MVTLSLGTHGQHWRGFFVVTLSPSCRCQSLIQATVCSCPVTGMGDTMLLLSTIGWRLNYWETSTYEQFMWLFGPHIICFCVGNTPQGGAYTVCILGTQFILIKYFDNILIHTSRVALPTTGQTQGLT